MCIRDRVVLFGSAKLPKAAKSMGEAMRIFKKESAKLHEEDPSEPKKVQEWTPQQVAPPQAQVTPQPTTQEQQVAALQEQLDALKQQQMAGQQPPPAQPPTTPAPQQTNQSS